MLLEGLERAPLVCLVCTYALSGFTLHHSPAKFRMSRVQEKPFNMCLRCNPKSCGFSLIHFPYFSVVLKPLIVLLFLLF